MHTRNLLTILTLLTVTVWLPAQITVTNAVFPEAGDTLKTAIDFTPEGITITAPGGPFTWDFSSLTPDFRQTTVFQEASNGTAAGSFPGAELVTISDVGGETYFDVSASVFATFGVSGTDVGGGFPIETDFVFSPPLPDLHAPLTFPNVYDPPPTSFGFSISSDVIPSEILDSLGVPSGFLDSIRLRIIIDRNDFVDAFGTASIPGGTYEVLREKRTDITDTRLEIHIPVLGWQDVTELLPIDGFGRDTVVTYNFISNTAKEPIAVMTMDSTGLIVQQVDYKDNGIPSAIDPVTGETTEVVVSPNPAYNEATFDLKNLTPGQYTLRLFDAYGQQLMNVEMTSDRQTISLDGMSGGMYLYQLVDEKDRIQAKGRLVKVGR